MQENLEFAGHPEAVGDEHQQAVGDLIYGRTGRADAVHLPEVPVYYGRDVVIGLVAQKTLQVKAVLQFAFSGRCGMPITHAV